VWPPRITHAKVVQQQIPLAPKVAASPSSDTSIEVMWTPLFWDSTANATSTRAPTTNTNGSAASSGAEASRLAAGGGQINGGCAPLTTHTVVLVCAKTGKQVRTQVYDASVTDCCIQDLGSSEGDEAVDSEEGQQYYVSVFASNALETGMLSAPALVRLKSRKVPSSADTTFEFTIGGVRFRRPVDDM